MRSLRIDVLLAVLPFGPVKEPTIGVSILKAAIERAGFSLQVRYFNLDFTAMIGLNLYHEISHSFASRSLVGDWVFSEALFGDQAPNERNYVAHLLADYSRWEDGIPYGVNFGKHRNFTQYVVEEWVPQITKARRLATEFVDQWSDEILTKRPRMVGFTTSCHQACSCLAVARRLKESPQSPIIIFGGANCHGEMGLQWLHSFPWIDYVCTGEGDEVFPTFLKQFFRRGNPRPIPGILGQKESLELTTPKLITDLDRIPIPDYSDYIEELKKSPMHSKIGLPILPIETSRGCWWGQKRQCVFCGNSRKTIPFRSKTPERVVNEIMKHTRKHAFKYISCTDDTLDRAHIETVFPKLRKNGLDVPISYQTRPNLNRHELLTLLGGGVKHIQPGIESFSDEVLRLMRKGSTGLQNIQLLRWCVEVGMRVGWNILYGLSGEPISEYKRMTSLIPLLTHLPPPIGCTWIALDRFSPYWTSPEEFGLKGVRPWPSYSFIFPLGQEEIERFAYFFDFEYEDGRKPFEYSRSLRREVGRWIILWQGSERFRPRLDLLQNGNKVVITDTRPCALRPEHRLKGLPAEIYMYCDTIRSLDRITQEFDGHTSEAQIRKGLRRLVEDKLMIEDKGKYLSLAIVRNRKGSLTSLSIKKKGGITAACIKIKDLPKDIRMTMGKNDRRE